jgi:type I restriction enzyme S subunit
MSFPCYSKYKASGVEWLGDVPEEWGVVQYKQFVDIQNGLDHKHVEQSEGYPVFGSGGIFAYASEYLYEGESVLLGRKGTIDKPLYINGRFWTVDTMYWTKIRANTSGRYAYYLAVTIPFDYYSTNTALPSMTKSAFNSHRVMLPPLPEQTAIANFLDRETAKIDELVAEQRRLIELLKEKRQAVISHAVTKGINLHVPMKPSGVEWLGDVPEQWRVLKLKFICKVQTGDKDTENAVEGGLYPFFVRSQTVERINTKSHDCEAVLTAGDGVGVGKVFHHHKGPFDFHQRVYMMSDFVSVSGRFFFHYMRENFFKVALEGGAKSTVDSLRRPMFMNFPVCVPPQAEQDAVVVYIERESSKFDTLTAEAQRAIDLLQERRTALISAAVTGQIDIRQQQETIHA